MSKPNIYDQEFAKRMEMLMNKSGGSIASLAKKLEVSPPTITRWIKGEADPTRSNLIKIAQIANVDLSWLILGEGNDNPSRQQKVHPNESIGKYSPVASYSSICVSAGFGSFNEGVTKPDGQELYSNKLLTQLDVQADKCGVFWAKGNSMEPTISNGSQMLVDLTKTHITGNNIYLIQNDDSVWVKRIRVKWDGVELISDNKEEYEPIVISTSDAQNLKVIGRVVHVSQVLI